MLGLIGVLIAVLVSGFNEHVIEVELDDIQGAMGFSHDQGTWVTAIYEATEISAMAFAPWCGITFSIRRFAIAMVGLFAVLGAISPYAPNLPVLYVLRAMQGFAGGTLPPLLMTVALRYLPPKIKIHGLGAYTLTATFGPNMGTPLGACVLRISRLAFGVLGGDPVQPDQHRGHRLWPAAGSAASRTLPPVQLARRAARHAGDLHDRDRADPGRPAGLVQLARDLPPARGRRLPVRPVPGQ